MAETLTLSPPLVERLQIHARARDQSLKEYAVSVLDEAAGVPATEDEWHAVNERRVGLIDKQFDGSLTSEEEQELWRLQAVADKYLEPLDRKMLDDLRLLEETLGNAGA